MDQIKTKEGKKIITKEITKKEMAKDFQSLFLQIPVVQLIPKLMELETITKNTPNEHIITTTQIKGNIITPTENLTKTIENLANIIRNLCKINFNLRVNFFKNYFKIS
jgi:hypothetical protein